jgi:SAM-dependent methyltransferase
LHNSEEISAWVKRWSHLVKPGATLLDVACGQGRHMRWFAGRGCIATGVDQSALALQSAAQWGDVVQADIENGPWPFGAAPDAPALQPDALGQSQPTGSPAIAAPQPKTFDLIVVTNYLWRPLLGVIAQSVAPGGLLIYETFAQGNETVGKPSRADFLLRPGELLQAFAGLRIIAFEDGFLSAPDRFVQRLVAAAPAASPAGAASGLPRRYTL